VKKLTATILLIIFPFLLAGCGQSPQKAAIWGRVEAKELDINTKVPGRVIKLLVEEGQEVKKGQIIAVIDSKDLLAQKNQYLAQSSAAAAQAKQSLEAMSLQDQTTVNAVQAAQAQVEMAKTDLAMSAKNYQRFEELYHSGAISEKNLDDVKQKYQAAQNVLTQAQAALRSAQANQNQGHQVNQSNTQVAQDKHKQALAAVEQVQVLLDETKIKSPINGVVTSLIVEQGEIVSAGMPLMSIMDTHNNWVNLKIQETELSKYKLNSKVLLQGRDKKFHLEGRIVDISKKPEFATQRATDDRGETDITTFNVKVQTNSQLLRPGMRFQIVEGEKK